MLESNCCHRRERPDSLAFVAIRAVLRLLTDVIIEVDGIPTRVPRRYAKTRRVQILLSFDDRSQRNEVGVVVVVEALEEAVDDELQGRRVEPDGVQGFLDEKCEALLVVGFHLIGVFEDMIEQLLEPTAEEIVDANLRGQLEDFIDHVRQRAEFREAPVRGDETRMRRRGSKRRGRTDPAGRGGVDC